MMTNVKKLKKKIARAARDQARHALPAPRKLKKGAVLPIPHIAIKSNGTGAKKRPGPTSVRFTPDDMQLLNKLKERWKTDGPTTTLRKAMQLAESAVVCTFITEG